MPTFKFFYLLLLTVMVTADLKLSGIRKGEPVVAVVEPNKKFVLRVFGRNMPHEGYFFTTATRCQDHNQSGESTIHVTTLRSYCTSVFLEVPLGLPFNTTSLAYHVCNLQTENGPREYLQVRRKVSETKNDYIDKIMLCVLFVMMSAYATGMTLGYMKFSIVELNRMIDSGEKGLAKRAKRILHFRRRSNWLVVAFSLFASVFTVLFTITIESMLDGVYNGSILKVLIPTILLLMFAELLPQAVCNSRFGFNLASGLWFVSIVIFVVTFPIAYPLSVVLGMCLKRNVREVLTQEEKTCMIRNMARTANEREKPILENVTTFSQKKVEDLMVPIDQVFLLSKFQKLDRSTILTLVEKGYTRVPICDEKNRNSIVGMLNMKDLISFDLTKEPSVNNVLEQIEKAQKEKGSREKPFAAKYVNAEMNAQLLLELMKQGQYHFACVVKYTAYSVKVVGIITIEDILEQLFGKIDGVSENRGRSSVDDRADNAVIGWCRTAGMDKKYPLLFSQQLWILQELLKQCSVFRHLDVGIFKLKQLLSTDKIKVAKKDEPIPCDRLFIVIWKGTVRVINAETEFIQEVGVSNRRMEEVDANGDEVEINEVDAVPVKSASGEEARGEREPRPVMPMMLLGKDTLNDLIALLSIHFEEKISPAEQFISCDAVSDEVHYFALELKDLLNNVVGGNLPTNEQPKIQNSAIYQISKNNSAANTPIQHSQSPVTATTPIQKEAEKMPLLD